jgi:hypothetical protein
VLGKDLPRARSDRPHLVERDAGLRVEVDTQLIGAVEIAAPHRPGIPVDDAQVDTPYEVSGVVGDELARGASARKVDGRRLEPWRRGLGHAFLEEELAADTVDPAL